MQRIFKYELEVADHQTIQMPTGAQILCVQIQHGVPCLWVLVDPQSTKEKQTIRVYGTGHMIERDGDYVGTFQTNGLVFHVFAE